jgi:DNA-binding CsgD family transcriptional regulator
VRQADALTEREKETLRLLLAGHDAKSIARLSGLSIHTINERLRDARRKLGASSSREAARLLAEAERDDPHFVGDKGVGVAAKGVDPSKPQHGNPRPSTGRRIAWFGGGILIMSMIIAAILISNALGDTGGGQASQAAPQPVAAPAASDPAGLAVARDWIALLDNQRWEDSWRAAAAPFQAQLTAAQWAAAAPVIRQPLGTATTRTVQSTTETNTLPGAPPGQYQVVQFQTAFSASGGKIETVVLAREGSAWKVAGYFIR